MNSSINCYMFIYCRYAGRFDCGCIYEMECTLLNERKEPVTEFKCRESVKQWEGSTWHKVSSLKNVVHLLFNPDFQPVHK